MSKYNSWGFTIRPKYGIERDSKFEKDLCTIFSRFEGYHCVAEKEDEKRHIHAQVWMDTPRTRSDMKKRVERLCEKQEWWDTFHKMNTIKIKICYNDWYDGYLENNEEKELGGEVSETLLNNVPALTTQFYPSEEEQEKTKAKANAVDLGFHNLKVEYNEYVDILKDDELDDNYPYYLEYWKGVEEMMYNNRRDFMLIFVGQWYYKHMFIDKKVRIITDDRVRRQKTRALFE